MKWLINAARCLVLLALAAACLSACNTSQDEQRATDGFSPDGNRVIILIIDGIRYSEGFGDPSYTNIPRMGQDLRPLGTLCTNFRNEGLTKTNPGHASIVTGTWQHIANDGSERPDEPTLFEYYRKTHGVPGDRTYVVCGKEKLRVCAYSTHPDYGPDYGAVELTGNWDDETTYGKLISALTRSEPTLVMANLATVDRGGHSGNRESYIRALEVSDSLTARLWDFIQGHPFYRDKTYLFVTNDHGRHDDEHGGFENHGDECEGCRHIMLLALGPGIRANHTVEKAYTQRDLCNTAGRLLDVAVPHSRGVIIEEIFDRRRP